MTINEYKNLSLGEQNEFLKTTTDMVFLNMIINSNGKNFNEVKIILENELVTSKVLDNLYDKYKESNEYMEIFERNIVSNINCPKEIISDVYNQSVENMEDSTKDYKLVKEMIAKNPNTDYDILISLTKDNAKDVALNPNLQNVVIDRLFDEMDNINNNDILILLSNNENISNDTINKIINETRYMVLNDSNKDIIFKGLINNPNINENNIKKIIDVIKKMEFNEDDQEIQFFLRGKEFNSYQSIIELSKNPNTSKEVLDYLKDFPRDNVIENIINNPNILIKTLSDISNFKNKNLTNKVNEILKKNTNELNDFFGEITTINQFIKIEELSFREKSLLSKTTNDVEILTKLAKDENIAIKLSIILMNPNATKEIIEILCQDEDLKVSDKAMEKLATFEHNLKETINETSNYSDSNVDEFTSTSKNNHKHK